MFMLVYLCRICVKFEGNKLKSPMFVFEAGDDCSCIGEKFGEDEVACALLRMVGLYMH